MGRYTTDTRQSVWMTVDWSLQFDGYWERRAGGAGANYFYSVANINREKRPGSSYYFCLMLGWRQLQAAVARRGWYSVSTI